MTKLRDDTFDRDTFDKHKKKISIVIAAYNEESNLVPLVDNLLKVFSTLAYKPEIILIDDGSIDSTYSVIQKLAEQYIGTVKGIKLSSNCGQQAAFTCGMSKARGEALIMMDADGQHRADYIPEMLKLWEAGNAIVNTKKREVVDKRLLKRLLSTLFYGLFNKLSKTKILSSGTDFRLLDKKCVQALLSFKERHKFYRGLVPLIGFSSTSIEIDIPERNSGQPAFTFFHSLVLGMDGLISFSSVILWTPFLIGMALIGVCFLYYLVCAIFYITGHNHLVRGWLSLSVLIILMFAVQLIYMGIFGLYISKIFEESKRRPLYFVEEET